jgi:hypothetical protein
MTESSAAGEQSRLPSAPPSNHGNTVAAWVTVTVVLVGGLTAVLGVVLSVMWLFWVGLGVTVVGAVVGRVLRMLGLGQPQEPTTHAGPS